MKHMKAELTARAARAPQPRRYARPDARHNALSDGKPWYRHKWPWLLFAPPAFSIIGGFTMLTLALMSNDGLVTDDYYKEGRAINQTLSRERAATRAGLHASVAFLGTDRVRVTFAGARPSTPALTLHLVHPTRAGLDRTASLHSVEPGTYEGALDRPATGRWRVLLEDDARNWRMTSEMSPATDSGVVLQGR
jgi:uncharacterized protein